MSRNLAIGTLDTATNATRPELQRHFGALSAQTGPSQPILHVQQSAGNAATRSLLHSGLLQPKLCIAPANDEFEREADRVADSVTRATDPVATVQRKCAACDDEETLRRKADGVSGSVGDVASVGIHGGGTALSPGLRAFFEPRFGHDFSGVRIHSGPQAAASAAAINARAFTYGSNIVFAAGEHQPETTPGRRLLAHELAHVVQQNSAEQREPATIRRDATASQITPAYARALDDATLLHEIHAVEVVVSAAVETSEQNEVLFENLRILLNEYTRRSSRTSTPAPASRAASSRPATTAAQPAAPAASSERDWRTEVARLTTSQIESESLAIRDRLAGLNPESDEYRSLSRQLAALEEALTARQGTSLSTATALQSEREAIRQLDQRHSGAALAAAQIIAIRGSAETVFLRGVFTGFVTEFPAVRLDDFAQELQRNGLEFYGGYLTGIPIGLWNGLTGLIEGLGFLLNLAYRATPMGIAQTALEVGVHYLRNPQALAQDVRRIRALVAALQSFGEQVRNDPTVVLQMSGDLGVALGQHAANWFAHDFLDRGTFEKGQLVGNVAGQILFEVLLEVILALATAGIANVARGVAAGGQGTRAGGRVASIIRRMLEASPALRRVVRSLHAGEEVADVARGAERVTEAVRGGEHVSDVARSGERATEAARVADEPAEAGRRISQAAENAPPGRAVPPVDTSRRVPPQGHRGATAEGAGESFRYEYHPEIEPPVVERGRARGGTEVGPETRPRPEPTPEPAERFPDLEEGVPPSEAEAVLGRLDEGIPGQRLRPTQALPESAEAAARAGVPQEVYGDGWVMTRADFPDVIPDRPVPPGRTPPARRSTTGRRVSSSEIQNAEVRADLRLTQDALEGSGARIVDVRIDQTQVGTAGGRVGTNRPDLQFTVVEAELSGRRVYIEYDRSPPTRAIDHARRILANDPDAIVILKVIDFEPIRR